jgi:flagellar biosynthesis chaperone FliJ
MATRIAAEDIRDAAEGVAREAQEQVQRARAGLESVDQELRAWIEERPLLVVLGAVAAGFVFARLLSHR